MRKAVTFIIFAGFVITLFTGNVNSISEEKKTDFNEVSKDLQKLSGSRTRVVWVQDNSEKGNDVGANGNKLLLMGFDTKDKKGPHPILPALSNYLKPLITPKGNRVVFTNRMQKKLLRSSI